MNMTIKTLAVAIAAATLATPALAADEVKTKGGFQIKSEDGNFEFKLGGRIHFDGNYYVNEDNKDSGFTAAAEKSNSQFFFRRARLSLEGKAYDWNFKFENDFATSSEELTSTTTTTTRLCQNTTTNVVTAVSGSCPAGTVSISSVLTGATASTKGNEGFREMWIGRKVLGDKNLRLGQAKRECQRADGQRALQDVLHWFPPFQHEMIYNSEVLVFPNNLRQSPARNLLCDYGILVRLRVGQPVVAFHTVGGSQHAPNGADVRSAIGCSRG